MIKKIAILFEIEDSGNLVNVEVHSTFGDEGFLPSDRAVVEGSFRTVMSRLALMNQPEVEKPANQKPKKKAVKK